MKCAMLKGLGEKPCGIGGRIIVFGTVSLSFQDLCSGMDLKACGHQGSWSSIFYFLQMSGQMNLGNAMRGT